MGKFIANRFFDNMKIIYREIATNKQEMLRSFYLNTFCKNKKSADYKFTRMVPL
jgi:hypothetical protein